MIASIKKNQFKILGLSSIIWLPVIIFLSPQMNSIVFVLVIASGAWFSKGSVEVSYHYKENFEQEHLTWPQMFIASILVPFWFWCLNYKKPY